MAQGRPRFWCDVLQAHVLRAQGPGPVITLTDDLSHSWLLAELPAFMEAASNHFRSCVHSSWQLLCGDGGQSPGEQKLGEAVGIIEVLTALAAVAYAVRRVTW